MHFDNPSVPEELLITLSRASLQQGRDLIVIDPRGTGQSRPRLICTEFIEGERKRFKQNLTLSEARNSMATGDQFFPIGTPSCHGWKIPGRGGGWLVVFLPPSGVVIE